MSNLSPLSFSTHTRYTQSLFLNGRTILTDQSSRAEKTAATLEAQLNSLEQKLDNFLAEHDRGEEREWGEKENGTSSASEASMSDKDDTEKAKSS